MYLDDSALIQCRIGLISEVIVISIVNPIPALFQSLFFAILSFHFFPKGFCACENKDTTNEAEAYIYSMVRHWKSIEPYCHIMELEMVLVFKL